MYIMKIKTFVCCLAFHSMILPSILAAPGFNYEYLEIQRIHSNLNDSKAQIRSTTRAWKNQSSDSRPAPLRVRLKHRNSQINQALYERAKNAIELCQIQSSHSDHQIALIKKDEESIQAATWWKIIDKKNLQTRQIKKIDKKKSLSIVNHSALGLSALDQIDDLDITQGPAGLKYYQILYRYNISNQIALGQFNKALQNLLKLQLINEQKPDWIMQYYFFLCYKYKYNLAKRNNGVSDLALRKLVKTKNDHLEKSVRARFGEKSPELEKTMEYIRNEELGSPRI